MPEYLNEDFLAVANDLIFPSVQTCNAVIVSGMRTTAQAPRWLGGYHGTMDRELSTYEFAMTTLRQQFPLPVRDSIDQIYLVGNIFRNRHSQRDIDWERTMLERTLGCSNIRYFDKEDKHESWAIRVRLSDNTVELRLARAVGIDWNPIRATVGHTTMGIAKVDPVLNKTRINHNYVRLKKDYWYLDDPISSKFYQEYAEWYAARKEEYERAQRAEATREGYDVTVVKPCKFTPVAFGEPVPGADIVHSVTINPSMKKYPKLADEVAAYDRVSKGLPSRK